MDTFRAIVFVAALAGTIAGLFMTAVQRAGTVPLILQAEVYEQGAAASATAHDHGAGEEEDWAPRDGLERTAFTAVANVVTGIGFALLLVAGFASRGRPIGWREGLLWGIAAFVTFTVAPSLGLPPELPGMPAAPLGPRQAWWVATVAATAAGIGLLAFRASPVAALAAVALLVAPHLVGAPQPTEAGTSVPETLAHGFVVAVTVTSFLFWTLLGVLAAVLFGRFAGDRGRLVMLSR